MRSAFEPLYIPCISRNPAHSYAYLHVASAHVYIRMPHRRLTLILLTFDICLNYTRQLLLNVLLLVRRMICLLVPWCCLATLDTVRHSTCMLVCIGICKYTCIIRLVFGE